MVGNRISGKMRLLYCEVAWAALLRKNDSDCGGSMKVLRHWVKIWDRSVESSDWMLGGVLKLTNLTSSLGSRRCGAR